MPTGATSFRVPRAAVPRTKVPFVIAVQASNQEAPLYLKLTLVLLTNAALQARSAASLDAASYALSDSLCCSDCFSRKISRHYRIVVSSRRATVQDPALVGSTRFWVRSNPRRRGTCHASGFRTYADHYWLRYITVQSLLLPADQC